MSPALPRYLLQSQSDARLIELARAGHERAFEALVQRYRKSLLRYCQRLLLPESRAEDAIQQALLSAWTALDRGVEVSDAKAWLYRIVHNTAISALRRSGYDYAELSESLQGADAPGDDLDRRIAVREALAGLAGLPELQREALLRTAVEGQSHEQVALSLGISDGAVRGMVYRARATLRSAATAFTPPPVAAWLAGAGAGGRGAPLAARLTEVSGAGLGGAGLGGAGLAGALLKGGVVAVTAGTLATGAVLADHRKAMSARAMRSSAATQSLSHRTGSPTSAAGRADSHSPGPPKFGAGRRPGRERPAFGRPADQTVRAGRPIGRPFTTLSGDSHHGANAPDSGPSDGRHGDGGGRRDGGGDHAANGDSSASTDHSSASDGGRGSGGGPGPSGDHGGGRDPSSGGGPGPSVSGGSGGGSSPTHSDGGPQPSVDDLKPSGSDGGGSATSGGGPGPSGSSGTAPRSGD